MKNIVSDYLKAVVKEENFQVCDKFFEDFYSQKENLLKLFKGNLIVEKEINFYRNQEDIMRDIADSDFRNVLFEAIDDHYTKEFGFSGQLSQTFSNYGLAGQYTEYDISLKDKNEKIYEFKAGAKITKLLRVLITDKTLLERIITIYSEFFNNRTIKGKVCLSIHPMDYLTVSVNNSKWTSCFSTYKLNREGELVYGGYVASVLDLINSPNTIVAYVKSEKDELYAGVPWNNKKWRALITLDDDANFLHIGRQYPYFSKDIVASVLNLAQESFDKEYSELPDEDTFPISITTPSHMYNDCESGTFKCFVTEKRFTEFRNIEVSPLGATCIKCGEHYSDYGSDGLMCGTCRKFYRCDCCKQEYLDPERGEETVVDGRVLCKRCLHEHYIMCDNCFSYHKKEEINTIKTVLRFRDGRPYRTGRQYVCNECLAEEVETKGLIKCPNCLMYHHPSLITNAGWCSDCLETLKYSSKELDLKSSSISKIDFLKTTSWII